MPCQPLRALRPFIFAAGLVLAGQALALQAGFRQTEVPGVGTGDAPIPVALYYPTQAAARAVAMGPFTPQVAINAPPEAQVKGLIVLSHGTGGSELGHTGLAQALAQAGYLVAALRHPGDNWQDATMLKQNPARYFDQRPRQASRVIDALLADPQWRDRIASDAQGPRGGAVGHSAGGYTVLALAGAQPDLGRIGAHCQANALADPVFCGMSAGLPGAASAQTPTDPGSLVDKRVRAVVALAPLAVVFTPPSLASVRVPVSIYVAEKDRWLVPRFHGEWAASLVPGADLQRVPNAWHFAFMDKPGSPIPTPDGDVGADPAGFDRAAFLQQLGQALPAFFDKAWR